MVEGFEPLIEDLALPDPGDRHVVAAAMHPDAGSTDQPPVTGPSSQDPQPPRSLESMSRYLGLLGCCVLALGCATTSGGARPSGGGHGAPSVAGEQNSTGETAPDDLVDELLRGARLVPEYKADTFDGFKLAGVRPGSLYARYGIQNGDVMKRLGGLTLDRPERLQEALDLVNEAGHADMELLRGDELMTLRVELLPDP